MWGPPLTILVMGRIRDQRSRCSKFNHSIGRDLSLLTSVSSVFKSFTGFWNCQGTLPNEAERDGRLVLLSLAPRPDRGHLSLMRSLLAIFGAVLLSGCFTYMPIEPGDVEPGLAVRARVSLSSGSC